MIKKISPSLEHYLETIYLVRQKVKWVRVKDLVRELKVKAPSVLEAVNSLKKKGLVLHERYGDIELTPKGMQVAGSIYQRHTTLKKLFHEVLALDERIAEENACRIEHYLSQDAIGRIVDFIHFVEDSPRGNGRGRHEFIRYMKRLHGGRKKAGNSKVGK